ncbi:MAG: ArsR/SmtB family transcription factor [Alphaproteobacteria bacterium]
MPTTARRYKDAIYEQLGRVGKAIASPRRLELLDLLSQGPRTVDALARQVGQSLANTSHHLQVLRAARLVETEREGAFVTYRLASDEVSTLYLAIRDLARSRLVEVDRVTHAFLVERGAMEAVDREALLHRVRRGEVTVLDVRPAEEYRAGHIAGAISVPLAELERRLVDLPTDREIVAYCRGPYCVMALEAVEILRAHGFKASRLDDGVPDWRAKGLPVERPGEVNP